MERETNCETKVIKVAIRITCREENTPQEACSASANRYEHFFWPGRTIVTRHWLSNRIVFHVISSIFRDLSQKSTEPALRATVSSQHRNSFTSRGTSLTKFNSFDGPSFSFSFSRVPLFRDKRALRLLELPVRNFASATQPLSEKHGMNQQIVDAINC